MKIDAEARRRLEELRDGVREWAVESSLHSVADEIDSILREAETSEPTPSQQDAREAFDQVLEYAVNSDEQLTGYIGFAQFAQSRDVIYRFIEQAGAVPEKDELLELAWAVIANASDWTPGSRGPDLNEETRKEWQEAAEKWRDRWLAAAPKQEGE